MEIRTWGDGLWWAITTLTTTGYGDHVPVTLAGRLIGTAVMIAGVAVLGGVAAGVALVAAPAVAVAEEQALEAEAETLERRLELRLDVLDARLRRIEDQLLRLTGGLADTFTEDADVRSRSETVEVSRSPVEPSSRVFRCRMLGLLAAVRYRQGRNNRCVR